MNLRSKRFGVQLQKLCNVGRSLDVLPIIINNYCLEFLRASEDRLGRRSRLYLHSLATTNPHLARVVGYGPFSICVIQKEGCPNTGDIIGLMMKYTFYVNRLLLLYIENS
jgi:hypothetical protein